MTESVHAPDEDDEPERTLTRFGLMAKRHWEQFRPQMVARLKERAMYMDALLWAQRHARSMIADLVSCRGVDFDSARQAAFQQYILLPAEDEEAELSPDQMPFGQK